MAGSSSSTSTSTSTPVVMNTPQSDWGMQLSGLLSALGNNQYQWAMQQFNNGLGITNDNISHYMDLAGKGAGLAQDLITQYADQFKPIMDNYIQQAASYNSEDRQRFMAGQAESTVGQADTAARNESERQLQSYGINPNSGRSQEVIQSMRTADAAARAGAGTQASLDTADRGRAMTANIAAMGQNVPGMAVNALQSAYTGVTGAENAITSMLNTGANLTGSAAPFFNAASGAIKMPPVGNVSKSQQQSGSVQTQPSQSGGDKSGSGGKGQNPGQGNQGQGSSGSRQPASASTAPGAINPALMHVGDPTTKIQQLPEDPAAGWDDYNEKVGGVTNEAEGNPEWNPQPQDGPVKKYADEGTGTDPTDPNNQGGRDPWDPQTYAGNQGSPWWAEGQEGQPWSPVGTDLTQPPADTTDPWSNPVTQTGVNDQSLPAAPQSWNANKDVPQQPDPWSNAQNPLDQSQQPDQTSWRDPGQQTWDQPDQSQQPDQWSQPDQYQQPDQWSQPDQSQDQGDAWNQPDQSQQDFGQSDQGDAWNPDQSQQDYSQGDQGNGDQSYQDQGNYDDYGSGDEGYARGGQVQPRQRGQLPTTGGAVPRSASPSQGRQTDDISARLNAGEFVMPRDVVAHKGSEFFQNLIKKSRQARLGMSGPPAKPTMKPALRMRQPTFVSRGM